MPFVEIEQTNKIESLREDKMMAKLFPDRKDIFQVIKKTEEIEKIIERINSINTKYKK